MPLNSCSTAMRRAATGCSISRTPRDSPRGRSHCHTGAAADGLTAEGGSGWGLDLGVAWEQSAQSVFSLKLENLIHTISWNRNVEVTHYTLQFEDLTIDNFDD